MKNGPYTDKGGNTFWYKDDQYHRDGDLPAIEFADGSKFWWKNGVYIRREVTPRTPSGRKRSQRDEP